MKREGLALFRLLPDDVSVGEFDDISQAMGVADELVKEKYLGN